MKYIRSFLLSGILFLSTIGTIAAQQFQDQSEIPRVISYQAYVADKFGDPFPDGEYTVGVSLYPSTADRSLWRDTYKVRMTHGVISLMLGTGKVPLPDISDAGSIWIGIRINGAD